MNKKIKEALNKHDLTEFADKIAAKWQLKTQRNTPSKVEEGESVESILRDLVSMPTITGNYEANHEALEYVERFLSARGMYVKRYEWNSVESLIATTRRTKTPTVFLAGHMDVVHAPSKLFQMTEKEDKYFGRGVLDMKSGLAAYLSIIDDLGDNLKDYDFGVMITTDEEIGGFDGAQKLCEEGYLSKIMVLPDGGANWNPEKFAKGIWFVTLEATGKSAHGSRPWEGENAVDKLMAAIQEIRELFPKMSTETSTMNVGIVNGGHAINLIPYTATASIDFRFSSAKEQKRLKAAMLKIFERYGLNCTTEVEADPVENDINAPEMRAFAACTEAVIGRPVEWIVSNAGNDGRFFAAKGTNLAVAYPVGGNHHGLDEWISKESLTQMKDIYRMFLEQVAKNKPNKPLTAKAPKKRATVA
jgi:acetylornithine deacetylase/succinyl-diaminopimelate desuccinylase-like protein